MTNVMGSRFSDAVITSGGAFMLVVAMAAIDERVRRILTGVLSSNPSSEFAEVSVRAHRVARILMETADRHVGDAAPLALFLAASLLLAAMLLRT